MLQNKSIGCDSEEGSEDRVEGRGEKRGIATLETLSKAITAVQT